MKVRWLPSYVRWWLRRPKIFFLLVLVLLPFLFISIASLAGNGDTSVHGALPVSLFRVQRRPVINSMKYEEEKEEMTRPPVTRRAPVPLPQDITKELSSRVVQMREKCSKFGLDKRGAKKYLKPNPWEYYINKKFHLVWCPIFKAGASSMMYSFLLMSGALTEKQIEETLKKDKTMIPMARKLYPRPSVKDLTAATEKDGGSIVFLIVRDPFQRLYSAYQDKILDAFKGSPHDKMGRQIILKYRSLSLAEKLALRSRTADAKPTFEEFVRYILVQNRRGNMDMHWIPYYQFCTPCQVSVNMILKMEDLDRDQTYLFEKIGASDLVRPRWENKGRHSNKTKEEDVVRIVSSLPVDVLRGLIDIYDKDFQLFGYSIDKYRAPTDPSL